MRKLLLIGVIALLAFSVNAQINTHRVFGTITASDISANPATSNIRGTSTQTQVFLRLTVAETAYEIPLVKNTEGQWFSATGIGASAAFYKLVNAAAVERFSLNLILFTPNTDSEAGVSTALTVGVPIPKVDLPILNAGIRYDWKTHVAYLQTSVTLEF